MKKEFGSVLILLIVTTLIVVGVGVFVYFKVLNKPAVSSPVANTNSQSMVKEKYENPFASDASSASGTTETVNPFDESESYTNPFEDL